MSHHLRFPALALTALAVVVALAQAAPVGVGIQDGSKLWLTGKSTMHPYSSTASRLQVVIEHDPALWPADASGGEHVERLIRARGIKAIEVVVGVTGMRSGKDGLDRNMYKALLAEKHPEIRFRMAGYEVGPDAASGDVALETKGMLTVAGVEKEIRMTATAKREGDHVRLQGNAPLLMTQFGIKPPKMMMGALRTSDEVVVHFDLLIGAGATGPLSRIE